MNKRFKELARQAGIEQRGVGFDAVVGEFANLIIKECISILEEEREYYSKPGSYESREYYERCASKEEAFADASSMLKYRLLDE